MSGTTKAMIDHLVSEINDSNQRLKNSEEEIAKLKKRLETDTGRDKEITERQIARREGLNISMRNTKESMESLLKIMFDGEEETKDRIKYLEKLAANDPDLTKNLEEFKIVIGYTDEKRRLQ